MAITLFLLLLSQLSSELAEGFLQNGSIERRCILCRRSNRLVGSLRMVSLTGRDSSPSSGQRESNVKYPTTRGSTVDSRLVVDTETMEGLRVRHILFASEEMATTALDSLRSASVGFEELAKQISNCEETRSEGGDVGWMNSALVASGADQDAHLNPILPVEARRELLQRRTKPGDVVKVQSSRGYHLVQVADVMVDVLKVADRRPRRSKLLQRFQRDRDESQELEEEKDATTLTYEIETMGCQMNMADSERMEGQLQSLGIRRFVPQDIARSKRKKSKEKQDHADIVVFNTCSIRDHAEQKVYSHIGPYAKRKREGHDVTIVVAGCVAQQEGEALLRRAPEVDLVMGPQYANRLADLLEDVSNGNQVVATEASHIMEDATKPRRGSTVVSWVNVIYGCNERCTFCVVPTTRGVEQSRPVESIVSEVTELVDNGYKEVTLLGQNIDAYGRDMVPKRKFSDLLRTVGAVPGLRRLRFVTSHPRYMTKSVVDAVAETPTACESFHVPFQSGSNEVLAAMGRGHTREKYLSIVESIRERIPDASITADVIVGFPGETEEQFLETLSLMEEVVFDSVNTAAYSPRPNTPAALWENQLPEEVKMERLRRINELNAKHAEERRARMKGRILEVLIEERNVKVPTQVMGRSRHGYIVYCDGDIDELRGKFVKVHIDACRTYHLAGKITEVE